MTYSSPAGIPRPVNDAAIKRALQRLASPLSIFIASGSGHQAGFVPDPGAVSGTTRFLREDATWTALPNPVGSVTSITVTVPSFLAVSPATITTSGTFAITLATESAKTVLAGPTSGSAAAPTFRALANTDLVGATIALFTGTQTVTVANTVTETSLMPTGQGSLTLAANYLTVGKQVRFRCKGFWSTKAVGPGNITFNFKVGGTTVATSGAFTLPTGLGTLYWDLEVELTCFTTGAGGTMFVQGRFQTDLSAFSIDMVGMVNTTASAVNTTTTEAIDLTATWSVNDVANTITLTNASLEGIN